MPNVWDRAHSMITQCLYTMNCKANSTRVRQSQLDFILHALVKILMFLLALLRSFRSLALPIKKKFASTATATAFTKDIAEKRREQSLRCCLQRFTITTWNWAKLYIFFVYSVVRLSNYFPDRTDSPGVSASARGSCDIRFESRHEKWRIFLSSGSACGAVQAALCSRCWSHHPGIMPWPTRGFVQRQKNHFPEMMRKGH